MAQGVLRENFFRVAERVESLSGIIDPAVPESLTYAQEVLVQIVKDLTTMAVAGQRLDEQTPGSESTLVGEIFGLLEQSKTLLGHIHRAVEIQSTLGTGTVPSRGPEDNDESESESESEGDSDESSDEDDNNANEDKRVDQLVAQNEAEQLNREEIGKLLVLTSRAYKSQIVSPNQRAFLKTQIIARHGMLRVVLQFPTLESIMAALKTISSSVDE
jgi:hypothetical protein